MEKTRGILRRSGYLVEASSARSGTARRYESSSCGRQSSHSHQVVGGERGKQEPTTHAPLSLPRCLVLRSSATFFSHAGIRSTKQRRARLIPYPEWRVVRRSIALLLLVSF